MNGNLFRTITGVLATVCMIASTILLGFGCHDTGIAGAALDCAQSSAPTWLVPWLGTAAAVLGVVNYVTKFLSGQMTAPTVAVSTSGAPGTVHPSAVNK